MDLRQLRYFIAVAEELSFSRAAERVHISQPPLSRQIAQLEADLGVRLLERTTHDVALTDAGRELLERAREMIAAAAAAEEATRRAARGETGRLSLGFIGSAVYAGLPRVLRAFRERYPEVDVALTQRTIAQQVDALHRRRIEAGVIRETVRDEAFASLTLFEESFVVALPATHPLAGRRSVPLSLLANERFIIFKREEGLAVYDEMVKLCDAAGFTPRIEKEAEPMTSVIGFVEAGMGVAIVPESTSRIALKEVVYRPITGTDARTAFALIWLKENRAPRLARFVEVARGVAAGFAALNPDVSRDRGTHRPDDHSKALIAIDSPQDLSEKPGSPRRNADRKSRQQ